MFSTLKISLEVKVSLCCIAHIIIVENKLQYIYI
jgi:hypothetical protein